MPLASLIWIVGPVVLLSLLMMSALRRAARRQAVLESARVRGRSSEAGLASAMTDALTRLRGQELAQRAQFEALETFLQEVVESLPHGLFVLGRDGNLRVANTDARRWLGVPDAGDGQVLWTLDGTEALRAVADACLRERTRRDATLAAPGRKDGVAVPVTAMPLKAADGEIEGVLYIVHAERVA